MTYSDFFHVIAFATGATGAGLIVGALLGWLVGIGVALLVVAGACWLTGMAVAGSEAPQ